MKKSFLNIVAASSIFLSGSSYAGGILVDAEALPEAARIQLKAEIVAAAQQAPKVFSQVRSVGAHIADMDAQKRGRWAPIAPVLRALGPNALLPMLEMLAFDMEPRGKLSDSAWFALQLGLLEAVGSLRDPRSIAVLKAVLDIPHLDVTLLRVAAQALGRVAINEATQDLIERSRRESKDRRLAILLGLGSARNPRATEVLAIAAKAENNERNAKVLARALGNAGNAGAWRLETSAAKKEEDRIKFLATLSLLDLYIRFNGEARQAASNGLMVVDSPEASRLIREASEKASPELVPALSALAIRLANNPTRLSL